MYKAMFIKSEEGLAQGGPISPLLANVMLNELDQKLDEWGYKFVRYADDLMIFTRGDVPSVVAVHETLILFSQLSGLSTNNEKTNVYFGGVTDSVKYQILNATRDSEGDFPFRY